MALRILLVVAIFAGLGSGGVVYYQFSHQIPALVQQREVEKSEKDRELAALNQTTVELKKTAADLTGQQHELASAKVEQRNALARADAQEKRAENLQGKLATVNEDLQQKQSTLAAYKSSNLTPDQVVKLKGKLLTDQKQLAAITADRDNWHHKYSVFQGRFDQLVIGDPVPLPPADLKGKVVAVDPKWDFVVLDIGGNQGVIEDCELLVNRKGRLIAKVIIRNVQKDRCVANIVSGWKLGEIMEGDVVTPAHYSHEYSYNW